MLGVCSNEGSWEVECPVILYRAYAVGGVETPIRHIGGQPRGTVYIEGLLF